MDLFFYTNEKFEENPPKNLEDLLFFGDHFKNRTNWFFPGPETYFFNRSDLQKDEKHFC